MGSSSCCPWLARCILLVPLLDYKPVPEHVVVIKPVSLLGPLTVSVLLDLFHLFLKAMEHHEGVAYRFEEDMQCLAHDECSHISSGLFCK